ncbi:MAG: DUF2958 domain-containing protein [Dehalococcoidia bacterium]|jgi:hypothetical protein
MKLLTKEILDAFVEQGDTSEKKPEDVKVIAKFFCPWGSATWYACEFTPVSGNFNGFVSLFGDNNDEAGPFNIDELQSIEGPMGLKIERDRSFPIGEYTLKQIMDGERP